MRRLKSWSPWLSKLVLALSTVAVGAGIVWGVAWAGEPRRSGPTPTRGRVVVERTAFRQVPKLNLNGGVAWLNTAGPIRAEELRGKVVLLDFWTYCCINCHHILPDLAKLEAKYRDELVVIGVHSPKFFAEHDTENIRRKVREYGIKHPVINDAEMRIWEYYGVNSWPTLALFDVDGNFYEAFAGEGHMAQLDRAIGQLVARARGRKTLNETPIKFFAESEKPDNTPLLFPGKVLADPDGKRLFVADTGHNRIVITDLQGRNPKTIGSGVPGLVDGAFDKAGFNRPQGMCLVGETLYVADTEDHALRAVDLKAKAVSTVAGNGQQSHRHSGSGPGKSASLNSPWDVILEPGTRSLLIAMAGPHQIWRYDLDSGIVGVWAGTGREDIIDGSLATAAFAQPSGLATDGSHLFVADSEVSGVRSITLDRRNHRVQTVVGIGLFNFDDIDGTGDEVRLQHCLGLAYGDGKLYIADSYNNKIKVCDPRTRAVETLVGARQPGNSDAPPRFYQPGGLSLLGSNLYVADTNNHAVRLVNVKAKTVQTLELDGLSPPAPAPRAPSFPNAQAIRVAAVKVAPGSSVTLDVTVPLAAGVKVNAQAPMPYLVESPGHDGLISDELPATGGRINPPSPRFSVKVPLAKPAATGDAFDLKLSLSAFVCNEGSNVCQVKSYVWTIPVRVAINGASHVPLPVTVQ